MIAMPDLEITSFDQDAILAMTKAELKRRYDYDDAVIVNEREQYARFSESSKAVTKAWILILMGNEGE